MQKLKCKNQNGNPKSKTEKKKALSVDHMVFILNFALSFCILTFEFWI